MQLPDHRWGEVSNGEGQLRMKRGLGIYLKLMCRKHMPKRIRHLSNRKLRTLLRFLEHSSIEAALMEKHKLLHGLAIVESSRRFTRMRKEIL